MPNTTQWTNDPVGVMSNPSLTIVPTLQIRKRFEVLSTSELSFSKTHLQFIVLKRIHLKLPRVHSVEESKIHRLRLLPLLLRDQTTTLPSQRRRRHQMKILAR